VTRIKLARTTTVLSLAIAVTIVVAVDRRATAQLASRPADEWVKVLDAPERLAGLRVDEVVARLKLKPGDVVADLGAGTGPFVVPFAQAVAPGKVYAVEIDRGFFPYIQGKAQAAAVANVQTVLGEFTDPKLPAPDVDVAFLHDVLHHVENRAAYVKHLSTYLEPTARIAVIDYHPAQSPHRDQPALQVSKEQAESLLAAVGFKPVEDVPLFADKWFVIFGR
jgi:SAM-dependent methyltransferase